ncbi:hypothetical protein BD289DRAFT_463995 [Coniella lustricola]|uniref:Rad50/SbcC-type AAA domain-containing protein n=1 Tax=Coniella lustricola TaxID=2025994 RepID=A0A2T2ZSX8_9PEZI|nr:hypothetical protein BD289DRAFT_463995 [Coniella lustricola]
MRAQARKWLLLADIHFKHADLDRITRTAAWISQLSASLAPQLSRIVICGDLLTTRASQPTHVLSACYRFLDSLVSASASSAAARAASASPRIHILLGNHDLAYRRDTAHATSALDALRLAAPAGVELHWDVGSHVWDGRRVLTLPFREAQGELVEAVARLPDGEAEETVAFAHLALHRAITQRYVVRPTTSSAEKQAKGGGSVSYHGMVGPGAFARLARTFTGHFHCHQTILQNHQQQQQQQQKKKKKQGGRAGLVGVGGGEAGGEATALAQLQGSVTYIGSPLQLTWADLWDEQRGVILFDPETLEHELVPNPHAVGYTTAAVDQVLDGSVDVDSVRGKHVMLLGDLTRFKYAAASDALVSLGARSIRNWSPITPRFQGTVGLRGLGASMPASDAALQRPSLVIEQQDALEDKHEAKGAAEQQPASSPDLSLIVDSPQPMEQIDLQEQVGKYVDALELDDQLAKAKDVLVQVGLNLLVAAASQQTEENQATKGDDEPAMPDYKSILPPRDKRGRLKKSASTASPDTIAHTALRAPKIFDAKPRSLTIANFLGVQEPLHLDFGVHIPHGLTFLVGENGSGKSTLIEAIVWCQFGKCLRSGLAANDVVNDKTKRNCSVRLEFDNGYAITRFRKHKEFGNRVLVELHGRVLPEFEAADAKTTQAGIDELLSMDYNTFLRTIVLGHESATSFLSSTPAQRRDLILSVLGLEILDQYATTTRTVLRGLNDDLDKMQSRVDALDQTLDHVDERIKGYRTTQVRLESELRQATKEQKEVFKTLQASMPDCTAADLAAQTAQLDQEMATAQKQVETLLQQKRLVDTRRAFEKAKARHRDEEREASLQLKDLEDQLSRLVAERPTKTISLQSDQAIRTLMDVQSQRKSHDKTKARLEKVQAAITLANEKMTTYSHIIETESQERAKMAADRDLQEAEMETLAADRDLIDFWSSALSQKARRVSSSSSSSAATTYTFREFVLEQSLAELNTINTQILAILFEESRHATALTTGMLRSLFLDHDPSDQQQQDGIEAPASAAALDSSLSVDSRLSYGKRSGGERKRIDLALFFALLYLGHARSPHRAHYMLVDEVFDSLDAAGQAAVVKWCDFMAASRVAYLVIITHSEHLVSQGIVSGETEQDHGVGSVVLHARMGDAGVLLERDGERVG